MVVVIKRIFLRLPRRLWHRKCMKEGCENEFETAYAPDRPEIVYCERCYQKRYINSPFKEIWYPIVDFSNINENSYV